MPTLSSPPTPEPSNGVPDLTFRWATARGDVVLTWKDKAIRVDGTLATPKETEKLRAWADEYELDFEGPLDGQAHAESTRAMCQCALEALVGKQVGDAGFLLYAVDKKGKGKVLQSKKIDLGGMKQVAKVPQVRGG